MTPEELLEHEEAHYKYIATLTLLGSWQAKLAGKRLTVIVYKARFKTSKHYRKREDHRCSVSYGERILTSLVLETPKKKKGSR